ncbi:MAG: glycosyltransferase family 2 protein [Candidatus Magasanikbacteria bacterium]
MFIAIVPAYNEEKIIGPVVRDLLAHVDKVVVVDDGSSDATSEIAQHSGAFVLRHAINRGQGAALETGDEYARITEAHYVLHFDADGQFDVSDIKPALEQLKFAEADMLFGSRFLGKKSNMPLFKKIILLSVGRFVNKLFGGLQLSDVHNGFRILNKRALDCVGIRQDGMAHATEIISLVKKNKLKFIEFPVVVTYHEYGQGLRSGIGIIKDLLWKNFLK